MSPKKVTLKKSIIRSEALLLIAAIFTVLTIYFTFFFEIHLKWLAQKTISKIYGAEVNMSSLSLSLNPISLVINNIQFTNHQKPSHNLFEIGELSFKLNSQDLMFASFTTEEAFLTGLKVNRLRKRPGYVSPETQKLISLSLDLNKNKKAVIANKTKGNILDNIASFSKSNDIESELKKFAEDFNIDDLNLKYKNRLKSQKEVLHKIEDLVQKDQFKPIEDQIKNIELKIKAKAEPLEILALGKTILTDLKTKKTEIQDLNTNFKTQVADLKSIKNEFESDLNLKKQILKEKFKIPDISPEALAQDFFAETLTTRFYLFNYWLEQIRKNSEQKVTQVTSKVLSENQSQILQDKIIVVMDASKKEKAIKSDIKSLRVAESQIIHFGSIMRPKFWIKKTILKGDAKKNQDLQNFKGEILNITSDQKLINKPIEVKFKGDLPNDNIFNVQLEAKLNHHLNPINETFQIAADYPISSFKIINDGSLKLFLNKASSRSVISGAFIEKQINNMTVKNSLNHANFLFQSSKSDLQKILQPIFANITSFDVDIFLHGALANPNFKIISSLTEKISEELKNQIAAQLNSFTSQLENTISKKTNIFKSELFSSIEKQQSNILKDINKLDLKLGHQTSSVNGLIKKSSENSMNQKIEKLSDKLADKLFKKTKPEKPKIN